MEQTRKTLVVVGGGISGLSAAYYAKTFLKEAGVSADIAIVEKSAAFGGKVQTLCRDGFVIEKGPDSFLARKRPIIDLAHELGLDHELTGTNPQAKANYIVHRGRLQPMPPGLMLGIPTEIGPFVKTGLISFPGKLRAALDLVIPRRTDPSDESLGSFLERRLGREVLEQIAEPLLAGIYAGDVRALSLEATFPQFRAVEQKYRSVILGMIASRKSAAKTQQTPAASGPSTFLTFRKGLSFLIEALDRELKDAKRIRGKVDALRQHERGGYLLLMDDGLQLNADAVILAVPAYAAAELLPAFPEAEWLNRIDYVSVANVVLAFDRRDVPHPLNGSGFLVPRREGRAITACTWTSSKWLHTAPEGKALLRCYVGRSGEEEWIGWSDSHLVRKVRAELLDLLGIAAEPLFTEVTRLIRSMPQYPVGHLGRIRALRERLAAEMPGVYVTGSAYEGVGLPDCVRQGKDAARLAVGFLAADASGTEKKM